MLYSPLVLVNGAAYPRDDRHFYPRVNGLNQGYHAISGMSAGDKQVPLIIIRAGRCILIIES